ncbi:MAG: hypothetical protein SchgKO_24470 [Schleiferiaceae bacterium]
MAHEKKLLLVDNSPFSLAIIHRLEKTFSLRIDYASSAEEALAQCEEVDYVVSNFDLSGMNGIEFLLKAKQLTPGLKFALLTGREVGDAKNEELEFIVTHLFFGKVVENPLTVPNQSELLIV